ncbi:SRPBCC domain-containing protein [Kribbella sp. NBC_00709]|uniref:SRPBCC domain-containing protein n=1 Tax=Kribbella sp. NBC_00709 TaxID=2975972 RepID=UPI002E2CD746|nr:SRPBCC domain-containing protein [Kribbella sp. NBC_00709]
MARTDTGRATRTDQAPQLRYVRTLGCDADQLWRLITKPEHLSSWLGPTVLSDTQYGGFMVVTRARAEQTGIVTICEPRHYFQAALDDPEHPASTVLVDVVPGHDGTYLILTHGGIHHTQLAQYNTLWTSALKRLEQVVEGKS